MTIVDAQKKMNHKRLLNKKFCTFMPQCLCACSLAIFLVFLMGSCTIRVAEAPGVYHQVKKGQYLWRIAKIYGVDMKVIMRANRLSDPNKLRVGQYLFIPKAKAVLTVETHKSPISLKKGSFTWPVDSRRITSHYGTRKGRQHKGIDIVAPTGTRVVAAASGMVVYSGVLGGYGNLIIIDHENGYSTVYAHNSKNLVKEGDRVKRGQRIGQVGSTGRSTGPHLHFEVRKGHQAVNPLGYLP